MTCIMLQTIVSRKKAFKKFIQESVRFLQLLVDQRNTPLVRAVKSESGLGLNFGLESDFLLTRNWPGKGGFGIEIGPKWATAGLGLKADSSRLHKNEIDYLFPKATLLLVHSVTDEWSHTGNQNTA